MAEWPLLYCCGQCRQHDLKERKLEHPLTMIEYPNFTEFLKAERPICPSSRCDPAGRSLTLPSNYYHIWHHEHCSYMCVPFSPNEPLFKHFHPNLPSTKALGKRKITQV